uniref:Uncharacterized protein n=1 Tax=Arundo donax TaxID=35708 RepID=A0A0A9F8U2_ARUDO
MLRFLSSSDLQFFSLKSKLSCRFNLSCKSMVWLSRLGRHFSVAVLLYFAVPGLQDVPSCLVFGLW